VAKTIIMNIATIIKIKIPVVFTLIILSLLSNKDLNNILSKYNLSSTNWKTSRMRISKLCRLSNKLGLPFGNHTDSVCTSRISGIFYKKLIAN
jgi:amino acid transporter